MLPYLKVSSIILLLFISYCKGIYSQEFIQNEISTPNNKKHSFKADRLFFGGGLGLQFGSITVISIAPQVGYRFTDKFMAGFGVSYYYLSANQNQKFSTNIYGGSVFTSYAVLENLFVRAEYEVLNLESIYFNPYIYPQQKRFNINSFLIGPGYRYAVGEHSYINFMILWNLNETIYSPYQNPIIRMNFEF